jgi:benzoyl-CoA reductase/2-hydroxyglutaryl-CoA dehydratase subunit BcrC/BadD/HgdB
MNEAPRKISLSEWDERYPSLLRSGLHEPPYGGPLGRHVAGGDLRLPKLCYDNSAAALRLWNFLLTEEDRLRKARDGGKKIVGTLKDLGTVPVLVYSLPGTVAFYPDGAWWIPCIMELTAGLLPIADSLGVDESFCPVRAMLGAFVTGGHFPIPDLLISSAGATCDDFSAIAQRLSGLGHPILWWEIPHRRRPEAGEPAVDLPGGWPAPLDQVALVRSELDRIRMRLEDLTSERLDDARLSAGIREANRVRRLLGELRRVSFTREPAPLPALELLIAEMLAIHFCSDRDESAAVLEDLLEEARRRASSGLGVLERGAPRVFWVNPVADLQVMNLLEDCGGRVCGTDYLFSHALDLIPEDLPPLEALARMALSDPMVGPASDRAQRICSDARAFGAEAVVVSRIPGASHCATEGALIASAVEEELDLPVLEIEVPPVSDALRAALRTRMEALIETVRGRRERRQRGRAMDERGMGGRATASPAPESPSRREMTSEERP